jgi:hypothetical protein
MSPFARKFGHFLENKVTEIEEKEKEVFEDYLERYAHEDLNEGEENPIKYEDMENFHCELSGGLTRLCFSTADDPFYKTSLSKFYPEATVFNKNGEMISQINPFTVKNEELGIQFVDDIRDSVLKINDDRKIQI